MRYLLINVPIRVDQPPNNFPTGLGIIAAVLENMGHTVKVLDVNAHRLSKERVIEMACAFPSDVIGISGLVSTFKYQEWLMGELKSRMPDVPIIAGGGCATSVPELMMTHTKVDYLVIGEGENTIVALSDALERQGNPQSVLGIAYRNGDDFVITDPRPLEKDLDKFPLPAYHLFPVDIYLKYPIWHFKEPAMNLLSSRGCPMSCRFCYNLFGRRSYRKRGIGKIIEEIQLLKKNYGISTFGFVDDNVTINRNHLKSMCDALEKEHVTWGCHGRVDTADDERLEMMAKAGCKWLGFGIESGSQRVLDAMNKRITVESAKAAIERTRHHGLFANATFIYGYPGEDKASIGDSVRFKLSLDILNDSFFATPYPGTELYTLAKEKGLIPDEYAYVSALNNAYDFTVNLTDIPDDLLLARKKLAYTELKTGLMFKHLVFDDFSEDKETKFLEVVDRFLNMETFTMESKGYALLALAQYYEMKGNMGEAFKTRSTALRFGVRIDCPPEPFPVPV